MIGVTCITSGVRADSVAIGGKPRSGHARPPLHVNVTPSTSTSYTPSQIRHAYGFDQISATGANQKIALVTAYGNASIQSDLNTFCSQFGINPTTIQILGNNTSSDTSWALETALDVEWAHAIAPGATIILSVAASSSINDLLNAVDAAVNAGATVVSMSWGSTEFSSMSYYDFHFNKPGVSFTASSGDNGAGVEWPAASPYVIGVGGTSLSLDSSGNRSSETAWSGSGGGNSIYYAQPSYQVGWQSSSHRGVPDVSLVADPNTGVKVYDSVNGGWYVVGGTSASSPQWAGMLALANQLRAANASATLTSPNKSLYLAAQGSTTTPYAVNGKYYYDVSSGSNGAYNAGPPYDLVTGVGSPVANALVSVLAPATVPAAPTSLTASGKTAEIDLQWNASTGAKTYNVSRATTSGGPYTLIASGVTTTSYQDKSSTLVAGTTYYYVVAAVNSAGTSPNSAQASAAPLAGTTTTSSVPAAPSNLHGSAVSSSQINLAWTNNANNATSIAVEVAPPGSAFFQLGTVSGSSTSCSVTGAASKTTYSFRIRAYNSSGYSVYSNTATVTTY